MLRRDYSQLHEGTLHCQAEPLRFESQNSEANGCEIYSTPRQNFDQTPHRLIPGPRFTPTGPPLPNASFPAHVTSGLPNAFHKQTRPPSPSDKWVTTDVYHQPTPPAQSTGDVHSDVVDDPAIRNFEMKLALAELDKLPKFPNLKEKSFDNYTLLDTWLTNVDLVCNSGHLPEKIICNRIRLLNSGPHNMMMTKGFSTVPPANWLHWNPYSNGKGDIIPGLRALITNQFMPPESKTHAMAKFYKIRWDSYPSPQEFLTNFKVNANLCPDPPSKEAR